MEPPGFFALALRWNLNFQGKSRNYLWFDVVFYIVTWGSSIVVSNMPCMTWADFACFYSSCGKKKFFSSFAHKVIIIASGKEVLISHHLSVCSLCQGYTGGSDIRYKINIGSIKTWSHMDMSHWKLQCHL